MTKYLIVNADDLGLTKGINKGIIEAHTNGVLTSASLMVDAPYAMEALAIAKEYPSMSIGLHFAATDDKGGILFDIKDLNVVEAELERQYKKFCSIMSQPPTHLDSHHHVHMEKDIKHLFVKFAKKYNLPIRNLSRVIYNGSFYGQWYDHQWELHIAHELITAKNLIRILCGLSDGITELGCHPAYVTQDLDGTYVKEREIELLALTDPSIKKVIGELGIKLTNYSNLPHS